MVSNFADVGVEILTPFEKLFMSFVDILPLLIAALILLAVGYLISGLIGFVVRRLLEKAGLDKKLKQASLADALGKIELSSLAGTITKLYLFIWFVTQAASIIKLERISDILNDFILWLPDLIIALIILVLGLIFSDYICNKLDKTKLKSVRFISILVKVVVLFFVFVIALKQIGLYVTIAETTFLIILGSFCLAFAIAIGIGFGAAMKDESKNLIKAFKKNL